MNFLFRSPPSGPVVRGANDGDIAIWNAALDTWTTGPIPAADSAWLQQRKILNRDDLVAVVAPVGGEFDLPGGSYGIKSLLLQPGEKLVIDSDVRIYGNLSTIAASAGTAEIVVREGGKLTLDSVRVNGRLTMQGATNTTYARLNNSEFEASAGPVLVQNGAQLWAVNSRFDASAALVCGVATGICRMMGCEIVSDGVTALGISNAASVELTNCSSNGVLSVTSTDGSLTANGGKYTGVSIGDCDQVRLMGVVLEGDGTGIGINVDPATLARSVSVDNCYIVNHATGIDLAQAALIQRIKMCETDFSAIAAGINLANGPLPVAGGGSLDNCWFSTDVAQATVGFSGGSTRWIVRGSWAANGKLVETAI